jgi:O-antigen/teichoic acid export membrane protein
MSGLLSRTAILTASRVSNFAIHLFSPLLLVRILDVAAFGQYQEFMIYAGLLTVLCAFAVDSSLTYFLPRFPVRERSFVSQTSVITLAISTVCLSALLLLKPLVLKLATYDLVAPLAAYVFFFVNLNWVEYYWIAKRRPSIVLYYSAIRLIVRIGVLLVVAYTSRDVLTIAWSLVAVEALRVLLVFAYFARQGIFNSDIRRSEVAEQLSFACPIGAAALLQNAGRSIGKIFISSTLGPAALAFYATGSYLQPIVRVARSGIEDAVYPELVRAHNTPGGALRLWQRVNVVNCVMFFPAFVLLVYYAEPIITTLFTSAYLPAVPIFNVYAFFLLRRCFSTDSLLRTTGRTGFMLWGTIGALMANILLILLLSRAVGMIGPAIAFITAEVALELYYAQQARRALHLSIANLADWGSIARIAAACALAVPILIGFSLLPGPELVRMAVASTAYFAIVLLLAYRFGVTDVGRVVGYVWSRVRARSSR